MNTLCSRATNPTGGIEEFHDYNGSRRRIWVSQVTHEFRVCHSAVSASYAYTWHANIDETKTSWSWELFDPYAHPMSKIYKLFSKPNWLKWKELLDFLVFLLSLLHVLGLSMSRKITY